MTDKQKYILLGLAEGKTQVQIARELGTTRQDINVALQGIIRKQRRASEIEYRHYPNLAAWMLKHDKSCVMLAKLADINVPTLSKMLRNGTAPRWANICKLTRITGMTAEELMYDGEAAQEVETDD